MPFNEIKYKVAPSPRQPGMYVILMCNYTGYWYELYPGRDMTYQEAVGLLPM